MVNHLTARLAWHMDGWNGRICRNPAANSYCVGQFSYPGSLIRDRRDLDWEIANAGQRISPSEGRLPPCIYSANAFGDAPIMAFAEVPEFFRDGSTKHWSIPPSTVTVWPYEAMYTGDVKNAQGSFDYDARWKSAKGFFKEITVGESLIFYYANYSNPLNQADERRYAVVGVSRIKQLGDELFYDDTSDATKQKFAGGFIWQRAVTSYFPDEGFRIPYHVYTDNPEVLEHIAFFPDNSRNFKYGSRLISDDDALSLVERFLEIGAYLKEIGDRTENWDARIAWLQSLIAKLWKSRGLYPGIPNILHHLKFEAGIKYFKDKASRGDEKLAKSQIFGLLTGDIDQISDFPLPEASVKDLRRKWQLREDPERELLQHLLPRFELTKDQIERLISNNRAENGVYAQLSQIQDNPYIISEQYRGDNPDDIIAFSKIDHGIFPSPELGGDFMFDTEDWRRLRAMAVEQLKSESQHTFILAAQVIHDINHRLSLLPEWKRAQYTERYLQVDYPQLSSALVLREEDKKNYLYLKQVFDAERDIEREIRALVNRPDIVLKTPVTAAQWEAYLYDPQSPLAQQNPGAYRDAIHGQVEVCQRIFTRPVSVLSGAAGTGKTTVIKAPIQAIRKVDGSGASIQLLAPTGKAADRIREATEEVSALTIHSFLSRNGWLNPNLTFKHSGGKQEARFATYIIDEASMLDLELTAVLFKAINWNTVKRLIYVGDPSQLPPIGRGRVFADVIDWLREVSPDAVGFLKVNLRQMENRINDRGSGIIDLAALYVRKMPASSEDQEDIDKAEAEILFSRINEGTDVDKDLRVVYWSSDDELIAKLKESVQHDTYESTGKQLEELEPDKIWQSIQVLSPYRGDYFGVENINLLLQGYTNGPMLRKYGHIDGIAVFDKVMQYRNRANSTAIWADNVESKRTEKIDVFNGEIGFVSWYSFDKEGERKKGNFRLERFQVRFLRKVHMLVGYGKGLVKRPDQGWLPTEKPEDNLELAYAISVHKAQGSEFDHVYFIVPKHKATMLSRELFYTGITRARIRCTLFVQEDIAPLLSMRRLENSHLIGINSSLFVFNPIPEALQQRKDWYEEGRIHQSLANIMVRSKSEVIIANLLFDRDIPFQYETQLYAPDGTFYLPDFTISYAGATYYWEHLGRLDNEKYRNHWQTKKDWYERFFPGQLVITEETPTLSHDALNLIRAHFS